MSTSDRKTDAARSRHQQDGAERAGAAVILHVSRPRRYRRDPRRHAGADHRGRHRHDGADRLALPRLRGAVRVYPEGMGRSGIRDGRGDSGASRRVAVHPRRPAPQRDSAPPTIWNFWKFQRRHRWIRCRASGRPSCPPSPPLTHRCRPPAVGARRRPAAMGPFGSVILSSPLISIA